MAVQNNLFLVLAPIVRGSTTIARAVADYTAECERNNKEFDFRRLVYHVSSACAADPLASRVLRMFLIQLYAYNLFFNGAGDFNRCMHMADRTLKEHLLAELFQLAKAMEANKEKLQDLFERAVASEDNHEILFKSIAEGIDYLEAYFDHSESSNRA